MNNIFETEGIKIKKTPEIISGVVPRIIKDNLSNLIIFKQNLKIRTWLSTIITFFSIAM
jgi:hypothetical protein